MTELVRDENGIFDIVSPGANMEAGKGVRREKNRLQLGLTDREIARVGRRIADLLRKVDSGRLPVW